MFDQILSDLSIPFIQFLEAAAPSARGVELDARRCRRAASLAPWRPSRSSARRERGGEREIGLSRAFCNRELARRGPKKEFYSGRLGAPETQTDGRRTGPCPTAHEQCRSGRRGHDEDRLTRPRNRSEHSLAA